MIALGDFIFAFGVAGVFCIVLCVIEFCDAKVFHKSRRQHRKRRISEYNSIKRMI
jgi:hypothetical protein